MSSPLKRSQAIRCTSPADFCKCAEKAVVFSPENLCHQSAIINEDYVSRVFLYNEVQKKGQVLLIYGDEFVNFVLGAEDDIHKLVKASKFPFYCQGEIKTLYAHPTDFKTMIEPVAVLKYCKLFAK